MSHLAVPHREYLRRKIEALLDAYRDGRFGTVRREQSILEAVLGEMRSEWNQEFPGFPRTPFPSASLRGIATRGRRDAHLKEIVASLITRNFPQTASPVILNPACVFGRHARELARRLPHTQFVATDITGSFDWIQRRILRSPHPANYTFRCEDVFNAKASSRTSACVFFGACGSLSDAAMDLAITSEIPLLVCRSCCHENIGGNLSVVPRRSPLNWSFRMKNLAFRIIRNRKPGSYFSPHYSPTAYPRSQAGRELMASNEILSIARHTVDSDLCRALIDLDRCLKLTEHGYRVFYQSECFVAQK